MMSKFIQALAALLPTGFAWPRDPNSVLMRVLRGVAANYEALHNFTHATVARWQPASTTRLAEWEAATGLPDACFGAEQTDAQRLVQVLERLRGVTLPYADSSPTSLGVIRALCESYGFVADVFYDEPFRVERNGICDRLGSPGVIYVDISTQCVPMRVEIDGIGDGLMVCSPSDAQLLCVLERIVAARFALHVVVDGEVVLPCVHAAPPSASFGFSLQPARPASGGLADDFFIFVSWSAGAAGTYAVVAADGSLPALTPLPGSGLPASLGNPFTLPIAGIPLGFGNEFSAFSGYADNPAQYAGTNWRLVNVATGLDVAPPQPVPVAPLDVCITVPNWSEMYCDPFATQPFGGVDGDATLFDMTAGQYVTSLHSRYTGKWYFEIALHHLVFDLAGSYPFSGTDQTAAYQWLTGGLVSCNDIGAGLPLPRALEITTIANPQPVDPDLPPVLPPPNDYSSNFTVNTFRSSAVMVEQSELPFVPARRAGFWVDCDTGEWRIYLMSGAIYAQGTEPAMAGVRMLASVRSSVPDADTRWHQQQKLVLQSAGFEITGGVPAGALPWPTAPDTPA
jgi:uncharacterized protein YmfQ (DUF2313 family)